MSFGNLFIGFGVKEVEHEISYRVSSELAKLVLSRFSNRTLSVSVNEALAEISRTYLTGMLPGSFEEIIKSHGVDQYFVQALNFIVLLYDYGSKIHNGIINEIQFYEEIKEVYSFFSRKVPLSQFFASFVGQGRFKDDTQEETVRFLTGSVVNPVFRQYKFNKEYPLLSVYYEAQEILDIFSKGISDQVFEFLQSFDPKFNLFLHKFYSIFATNFAESTDSILEKVYSQIRKELEEWLKEDVEEVKKRLGWVFGSEETLRIEMKYSGLIAELKGEKVKEGIEKLKELFKLPFDKIGQLDALRIHEQGSLESAIEEISRQRDSPPLLSSNLQKKTFIRSLSDSELEIIFKSLHGKGFKETIEAGGKEKGIEVTVSSMTSMALEDVYNQIFGEHYQETIFNAMKSATGTLEEFKVARGPKVLQKINSVNDFLQEFRGGLTLSKDKTLQIKAVIRGLRDDELEKFSRMLFKAPGASKSEVQEEITTMIDNLEKYTDRGIDTKGMDENELINADKLIMNLVGKMTQYLLSPCLLPFDLIISYINWVRDCINDINTVAESSSLYSRYLGKRVVYQLVQEYFQTFRLTDSLHAGAFLITLLSKCDYDGAFEQLKTNSILVQEYTDEKLGLTPKAANWTITNEIWLRHLQVLRERKESRAEAAVVEEERKVVTIQDKVHYAYKLFETAIMRYSYASSPQVQATPLSPDEEAKIIEFLNYLYTHSFDLFDQEFKIGREDMEVAASHKEMTLKEALLQLICDDDRDAFELILNRIQSESSSERIPFFAAEIIDVFNKSLKGKMAHLDRKYINDIRSFCQKYSSEFFASKFGSKSMRMSQLNIIMDRFVPDFMELQNHEQYDLFRDLFAAVFEDSIIHHLKTYNNAVMETERQHILEDMARLLWGRGTKINPFTILLNHLLQEHTRGAAEIGSDTWKRYTERCRSVIRRIDKTCYVIR